MSMEILQRAKALCFKDCRAGFCDNNKECCAPGYYSVRLRSIIEHLERKEDDRNPLGPPL
jgi:hypothetical protein